MSYDYPTSDDLLTIEEDLNEFLNESTVKQLIELQKKAAANSPSYGMPANLSNLPDYTYAEPYDVTDISNLSYCETAEFNPNTGNVDHIVVSSNNVDPLLDAMSRSDNNKTVGALRLFQEKGVTNTTQVSEFFAKEAMDKVYEQFALKSHILSNPSRVNNVNVVEMNFQLQESHTILFGAANKEFHSTFHKNFLLQMNHRITQEAIEKNRHFFANGTQRNPDHMRDSFTWDKFQAMAKQCAEDAFKRTQHMMAIQKTADKVQAITKTYSEQFKAKLQPKIKDDNLIQSFGKEFKARKNETKTQAVTRIRSEFKEHSNKKFDEFKGKGMDLILAQGIAQARGSKSVTVAHMKEATDLFNKAKKNPVEFRSMSKIFKQVTGNDRVANEALMHSMDGRSSFQRSRKSLETMGAHLYANSQGRTRIRKDDAIHGQAFAASATLGVPPKALKTAINEALKESSYKVEDVIKARQQMAKAVGRVKDERGKDTTRDELLKRAEPVQEVKQDKPIERKPDSNNGNDDDGGFTPDGSGGGRRRRR